MQAKWERQVNKVLVTPFHIKEVSIFGVYWDDPVSVLDVIFPMSAPLPLLTIKRMASSTVLYDNGNSPFRIPSLTLCSNGKDKSKIRRQVFGLFFFGITPKRLRERWSLNAGFHLGKLSSEQERTGKFPLC